MIKALQPIERENQRVMTTAVLAEEYGTTEKIISQNFNRNKDKFIEGKHYYCLEGEELKEFKITIPQFEESLNKINKLYLWTQKGALLHAKSLNTDRAWEVYEILIDVYFIKTQMLCQSSIQNNTKDEKIKIMEMNARTRAENAKIRKANTFLRMAKVKTLSKEHSNILVSIASEVLAGKEIIPLPKSVQKTYSAKEIGEMFGISANKVGRLSNSHNLKVEKYGEWYRSKSENSTKEVDTWVYYDTVIPVFKEILNK